MKDTARVLGRMYDGIEYRGAAQHLVETLGEFAGVPVWNGLTDEWHPTQSLCDMMTMIEHSTKPPGEIAFAYCGDARNNVGNSLLIAGAMTGMDVRIAAPKMLWNSGAVIAEARRIAETTGARIEHFESAADAVARVDFIYTDVWVSMGEPAEMWSDRVTQLRDFQVNTALLEATGNPSVKFMHCLPALHDRSTTVGEQLFLLTGMDGLEVTNDVFESRHSIVFDQAPHHQGDHGRHPGRLICASWLH
jgi:ornithine carbamoyltransferase